MALSNDNMIMPVAPTGSFGGGFGNGFGGDGWWILLLFILLGGWNNNGFNGGFGGDGLYPWMNQNNQINDGFRDQMINSTINGIQSSVTSGFGDVQNALCSGFAGVNASIANGFAQAEISNNARQVADLQQSFALQSQLAQCCCDNRLASADLKYTIATENCADRAAISDGIRDLMAATQAQTQTILDKLCQQEIDNLKTANSNLQTQVLMRDLAASQNAQTAALTADNALQTQYIVNRVAPYPVPAYTVANPYAGYNGCTAGCGCA